MPTRIAINGFGRIGRNALKIALKKPELEVVAVNDLTNARVLAHLLKYDSAYGAYPEEVRIEEDGKIVGLEGGMSQPEHFVKSSAKESYILVGDRRVRMVCEKDPSLLPWKDLKVDVVLECTGRMTKDGAAAVHINSGAKRVVVSAPTKGGNVETFLLGVNSNNYSNQEIISNASCTTNCISPVASIMVSKFGVLKAMMTTIHAMTAEQNLVDGLPPQLHEDLRRGRSAPFNIVPTTTGAAIATTEVVPELKGLFDGLAVRVPVLVGSLSDFTFLLKKKVTAAEVNDAFIRAKDQPFYRGILGVCEEPLVSSDIVGSPFSSIVDLTLTRVIDGDLVKVVAWYDNEWGYSNRLVELALVVGRTIPS
ncbi:MAG: type I glyceraldehyde-3-phosphate dehydrogenase [Patescibacteria group bacterium]|nr:type I glyceraldehyde-3-phosphate dehydrogenase [Patescibacteria group bacterium]